MKVRRSFFTYSGWIVLSVLFISCSSAKAFRAAKKKLLAEKVIQTAHIGISVYDAGAGRFIYNYQGDKFFVPASNTKIPTCYAAMKYLGDSLAAFRYVAQDDTIFIAGSGNPDFLHPDFKQQPALDFLKKYKHVIFSTQQYNEYLGSGWAWNDYKEYYMAQRSEFPVYGNMATFKWLPGNDVNVIPSLFRKRTYINPNGINNGFDLDKAFDKNDFYLTGGSSRSAEVPFVPDAATITASLQDTLGMAVKVSLKNDPLPRNAATVRSRPVDSVLAPMMHRSDNFFAEQMLLMISQEKLGVMNDEKIIDTLLKTDFAALPQKPTWVDGSGLSRYNLFSPQDLVFILDKMQKEFGMDRIKTIFPTGGEGTIRSYYQEEAGQIFAKTGTLSGVVSLSGFLYTKSGKLLLFSVLVNNHNGSATDVRHAVEAFVRSLRDRK